MIFFHVFYGRIAGAFLNNLSEELYEEPLTEHAQGRVKSRFCCLRNAHSINFFKLEGTEFFFKISQEDGWYQIFL